MYCHQDGISPSLSPGTYAGDDGADSDAQSEEAVEDMVPTVVITEQQQITLAAKAMFFDFEGRADGRSMRTIVSQIAPRQLVLVHGSAEATANMARNCQSSLAKYRSHVYTPGSSGDAGCRAVSSINCSYLLYYLLYSTLLMSIR